ncbi:hypothetical protein [Balneatrix alpica]|uniref:hypothetical protein n=1 Tax=Balneatrix alpica TaxID=75684 RepID=UPI002739CE8B|nr:hypothetical protein [Balneatrix alpica]
MKLNRTVSILGGLAATAAVGLTLLLPRWLPATSSLPEVINSEPCQLQQQPSCQLSWRGLQLTLSFTDSPLSSLTPLAYQLEVVGGQIDSPLLDVEGIAMYMGLSRSQPQQQAPGSYRGELHLGRCVSNRMDWLAKVNFYYQGKPYQAHFQFETRQ